MLPVISLGSLSLGMSSASKNINRYCYTFLCPLTLPLYVVPTIQTPSIDSIRNNIVKT